MKQFNNSVTPQMLADLDKSPFSDDDLAAMDVSARHLIEQNAERDRQHPITAIWRVAVEGSLTARGGVVKVTDNNRLMDFGNGETARIAVEGDSVSYPDGTSALIVSSAGSKATHKDKGLALVGSPLDNGDEIISTPQEHLVLLSRKGIDEAPDFLAHPGGMSHGLSK
ncbi:hypothetical protein KX75_19990 [Salmonella enterica subsp. enterica]|nr:hypothetical protein [Salmonella enterica subsp. enterica serovar Mikawasima]EDN7229157.1 PAAR domain-containing protein [Salmonella enterica subsp. enterica serovar Mikawasima]